jgi:DNA repair exonuclease SbcCD ATPase subunit
MKKVFLMLMAFMLPALAASAQDLAKLAKQSREQRMKVMKERSVRVYTNDNLPRRPAGEGLTAAGGMAAAPPALSDEQRREFEHPPEAEPDQSDQPDLDAMRDQLEQSRANLKGLEERLGLAEDELNLLRIQQASELAPDTQATLAAKIKDKSASVASLKQEIEKAKKEIEKAEKELKAAGGSLEGKK